MTWILAALLLTAGWIAVGWLADDLAEQAEYDAAHPPRHATTEGVDTIRLPRNLIGDTRCT